MAAKLRSAGSRPLNSTSDGRMLVNRDSPLRYFAIALSTECVAAYDTSIGMGEVGGLLDSSLASDEPPGIPVPGRKTLKQVAHPPECR